VPLLKYVHKKEETAECTISIFEKQMKETYHKEEQQEGGTESHNLLPTGRQTRAGGQK